MYVYKVIWANEPEKYYLATSVVDAMQQDIENTRREWDEGENVQWDGDAEYQRQFTSVEMIGEIERPLGQITGGTIGFDKYRHWVATAAVGRTPLDEVFLDLWQACREWRPIYQSLGNDQPEDPITWALRELEAKAELALADFPPPPSARSIDTETEDK